MDTVAIISELTGIFCVKFSEFSDANIGESF